MPNRADYSEIQLIMESVRFFGWLTGSICSLAILLLSIYLRMYVRDVLRTHSEAIQAIVAAKYVRRDVYDADVRWLRAQIEERA